MTQDVDFSAIVALSNATRPSVVLLRLDTARIEVVNDLLGRALPIVAEDLAAGTLVTIEKHQVRIRKLPII